MDLAAYDALKFEIATLLRGLRRHYAHPGVAEPEVLRDLFARLAEDRFNLAVVGRFSRGKTSLMNAILGTDMLPVGVLPITSVITMVSYGSEPKAVLHYQGSSLFMDIPIAELAEHITERGNPGNRRGIRAAEIQIPAEFLRRGFTFVDTPGLGSAIHANTRTTEGFLPEADALILVSSHDSPLSAEEAAILTAARAAGRALFVVLNKQDLVDPPLRAAAVAHVEAALRDAGDTANLVVFSVSARDGLLAKQTNNPTLLAKSGLPELEHALVTFLLHERRTRFLAGMCARMAPLFAAPGVSQALASRLAEIRARIAAAEDVNAPTTADPTTADPAPLAPLLPGCEVCHAIADAGFDAIAALQAQLSADRAAQADLARHGGFCRVHAEQFRKIAATREAATAFAPVLLAQAEALHRLAASNLSQVCLADSVTDLLPNGAGCPVCTVARKAEAAKISALVALIAARGPEIIHTRSALCLPHLGRLVGALADDAARRALLLREAALLERLAEDAQRFALQQDAVRRDISSKEDLAAAERSARVLLDHPAAQHEPAVGMTRKG
ncbi:dynamin family protein [Acidiphilium sp.]|uniref:dynamin family protein n=1 Tax=Acidiphilium sp. TaxID=527 RepID=UPI0025834394|nr:dynamin family protein [Acidiphilium sp.]